MSEFNIEVQGGSSVRLPTAGKYCDRDIIVTASGGGLPDWDDDSPIIASGYGYNEYSIWEATEKGTIRWKVNPNYAGSQSMAGWANSTNINTVPVDYIAVALNAVQIDIGVGINSAYQLCMPICKRVRMAGKLKEACFLNCFDLEEFNFSETENIRVSENYTLKRIVLPTTFTSLRTSAFQNDINLREINLNNIITYGSSCLANTKLLNIDVVFSAGLISIGSQSFAYSGIKSAVFQNSLSSLPTIANNAFSGCTNLKDIYVSWAEGKVANAPWGATNATIHYNTTYDENHNPIV